jgi:ATP-dependent HslUV protease subunit HslV
MTTIAYRDGIMAADSGVWHGDGMNPWATKVAKGNDGVLYGLTGNAAEASNYIAWVKGGYTGDEPKARSLNDGDNSSFVVVIAKAGDPIRLRTAYGDEMYDAPYISIGGGSQACYGAMYVGADAPTAIKAAIEHGASAIGNVQSVSFAEPELLRLAVNG